MGANDLIRQLEAMPPDHAFGVGAVQQRIALSIIKRWLGHAKIETTAIYASPIGEEERALARLMW
jgi:integrase/recombinase XerD